MACFSLCTCNSCHSLQNGNVTARHRKPFTHCSSPVFPAAAASIFSPHPAHWTCTPTPAPISHRPLAIARMFHAPSQLYFAAHVDFLSQSPSQRALLFNYYCLSYCRLWFFSGLVLNTLFSFLPG